MSTRAGRVLGATLVLVLSGGAGVGAQAQSSAPPPLTLDSAIAGALATHPALAGARAAVDRAEAGRVDARAGWLPSLSLDASLMRYQEPMVVAPLHGFNPTSPANLPLFDRMLAQGGLGLAWTVFDGARGARNGRARWQEEAAEASADGARLQVLADVARAFLKVGSTRELLDAHDRQVAALTSERDRAAKVLAQGRAARVTLLRAEAGLAQAQADREAARMDAEVAERDLARLMGVSAERVVGAPLAPLRPAHARLPSRDALQLNAGSNNPDVSALMRQERAARAGAGEARALWLPRVQLVGRLAQYGSNDYSPTREWQGGLQFTYPLLTGGARTAAGQRADADLRAARASLAQGQLRLASGVDQALASVSSAGARVQALETAVAQAVEVARIEKLALDAGSGVQTDYLTAEAQLLSVRASLTQARAAEAAARIELARLTGELSPDWLRANLESQP